MNSLNFTKQIQKYCREELAFSSSYAKDHKLTYYMAGGTLLGGVRRGQRLAEICIVVRNSIERRCA